MPRVHTVKKARAAARTRTCTSCREPIEIGQSFYTWAIKSTYGGSKYFRHVACGYPKPWELTHSKLGEVYRAQAQAEDDIDDLVCESPDDVEDALQAILSNLAEAINEVASEYRDAAEAMGGAGYENEERADVLESSAMELDSFTLSVQYEAPDEDDYTRDCDDCGGSGEIDDEDDETITCDTCEGTGTVDNTSESDESPEDALATYLDAAKEEARDAVNEIELP
jgi:hypothetical protein